MQNNSNSIALFVEGGSNHRQKDEVDVKRLFSSNLLIIIYFQTSKNEIKSKIRLLIIDN